MKVSVIIILAFLFGLLIFIWSQPVEKIEDRYIQELKNTDTQKVESVEIYNERKTYRDKNNPPLKVLSEDEIEELFKIFKTTIRSNKSHPHFISVWDVEIKFSDHSKKEVKLFLDRDDTKFIYLRSNGDKLFEGTGELKSDKLYNWMKEIELLDRVAIMGTAMILCFSR